MLLFCVCVWRAYVYVWIWVWSFQVHINEFFNLYFVFVVVQVEGLCWISICFHLMKHLRPQTSTIAFFFNCTVIIFSVSIFGFIVTFIVCVCVCVCVLWLRSLKCTILSKTLIRQDRYVRNFKVFLFFCPCDPWEMVVTC